MNPYHATILITAVAALLAIWFGPSLWDHYTAQREHRRAIRERRQARANHQWGKR